MAALLQITRRVEAALRRCAWAAAWLVMLEMIIVCAAVACAAAGMAELATWGPSIVLLGDRLTLTGLGELQWHIFSVIVMFGGLQALASDRHVRVDFLAGRWGPRCRRIIEIVGHLVLLIPFLAIVLEASLPGLALAWTSGAGSDYGGLQDRYLVKAVLPAGFAALLLLAMMQAISMAILVARPDLGSKGVST